MKRLLVLIVFCVCVLEGSAALAAHGHYTSGVEGLKAATLPPEGFYYRLYNSFYTADRYKNRYGDKTGDFNVDVFAMGHRFIYSSGIEVLGGNMIFDVVVPLIQTDIRMGGAFDDSRFGVGDILIEPLILAWHGDRYDSVLAAGVYAPTGYFDIDEPASPGKGFWTLMLSAGGTVYFDMEKTWHASIAARYEIHTRQQTSDVTPGNDFHFEWGIGKTIAQTFDVGLAGYCAWQVTEDSGANAVKGRQEAYAVGPEVGFAIPDWGMHVSLRSVWEFENKAGSEGNITTLTLTKSF